LGSARMTRCNQDGTERYGLSVAAFKCDRTHNIGRSRPKRDDRLSGSATVVKQSDAAPADFHSDAIPF
jgi:hypothetical protein